MRYILTLLMISAFALGLACQNAESSSTKTKNEKPADAKTEKPAEKEKAEDKEESHGPGNSRTEEVDSDAEFDKDGKAPRISLADAKKAFDAGEVVIVDTRSEASFKNEHIKGAINVPAGNFEKAYTKVPKDKKIITYCSWPAENTSARVVLMLKEKGYKDAYALVGGTAAWKNAGYPMETAPK